MESTTGKRVRESRRSEQSKRQSYSSSPAPRSSQKKPRKTKSTSSQYWPLKDPGILDEKLENNKWYYLVAWADIDPATGEEYAPSWEPYNNVTEDERAKWQKRKLDISQEQPGHSTSPIDLTQDSEPIRPAKRKRSPVARLTPSIEEPPSKIFRVERREAASPYATGGYKYKTEIKDSYEEEHNQLGPNEPAGPLVEVPIKEDFDRTAYAKLPLSSQLSQSSSQPGGAPSDSYSSAAQPRITRFIWDEDIIPDSQNAHGSSSLHSSGTRITGSASRPTSSESIVDRSSESQSQSRSGFDQETHKDRPTSNKSTESFGISSGLSISSLLSRNSPEIEETQNQARVPERSISSILHSLSSGRSLDVQSNLQPQPQPQSQLPSSPPFQTQVPFGQTTQEQSPLFVQSDLKSALESRLRLPRPQTKGEHLTQEQSSPLAREASLRLTESQVKGRESAIQEQNPLSGHDLKAGLGLTEFQVTRRESSTLPPILPRRRSALSYWDSWEASQVISDSIPESNLTTTRAPSVSSLFVPQHTLDRSHDSNNSEGAAIQQSLTVSQEDKPSSSHLPSPPFEHIISSIEPVGENPLSSRPATPVAVSPFRTPIAQAVQTPDSNFSNMAEIMDELQNPQSSTGPRQMVGLAQIPFKSNTAEDVRGPPATSQSVPVDSYNTLSLQQSIEDPASARDYTSTEEMPDILSVKNSSEEVFEEPNEYVVPLPMVSHPRDIYAGVLRNYRDYIYSFLNDEVFETSLVRMIDRMLDDLAKLCDHQNLHEDMSSTQIFDDDVVQAKWAENISTKCMFLAEFLMLMEPTDRNIIVLVRPGRMMQILESVFKFHKFVYNIAGQAGVVGDIDASLMRVTLLPTTGEEFNLAADMIIAFDATYTEVPNLEQLRINASYPNRRIPLISLVIIHSIEHLERHFGRDMEPIERKVSIVAQLQHVGEGVGKLPYGGEYLDPVLAAKAISKFIMNGANPTTWPILPLPEVEDLEYESQQSREQQSSAPAYYNSGSLTQPPSAIKRPLDDDVMQSESPKRPRLSPSPGEPATTHISETALPTSSSFQPNRNHTNSTSSFPEVDDESISLLKRLRSLEIKLKATESREAELDELSTSLLSQRDDLRASITKIQPKYQEALNDRGLFEHERNLAIAREAKATKNLESQTAALEKLKAEKVIADEQLAIARKTLSESTIPEIATMEALRAEVDSLKDANARLEKSKESSEDMLKYVREAYQDASSAMVEAKNELTELKTQNEALKRKADENVVRIHEIQRDEERKFLRNRIRLLQEEVKDRERQLEKAAREKEQLNLRRGTRGASTGPRSPRMGTMSPSARLGGVQGRFAAGYGNGNANGSRGNSPAPNEFGGDGRGWGTQAQGASGIATRVGGFGEVLFGQDRDAQGQRGPVRFGNHLQ